MCLHLCRSSIVAAWLPGALCVHVGVCVCCASPTCGFLMDSGQPGNLKGLHIQASLVAKPLTPLQLPCLPPSFPPPLPLPLALALSHFPCLLHFAFPSFVQPSLRACPLFLPDLPPPVPPHPCLFPPSPSPFPFNPNSPIYPIPVSPPCALAVKPHFTPLPSGVSHGGTQCSIPSPSLSDPPAPAVPTPPSPAPHPLPAPPFLLPAPLFQCTCLHELAHWAWLCRLTSNILSVHVCVSVRGAITSTAPGDFPTSVHFDAANQVGGSSSDSSASGGVAGDPAAAAAAGVAAARLDCTVCLSGAITKQKCHTLVMLAN